MAEVINAPPAYAAGAAAILSGKVRIGRLYSAREKWTTLQNPTLGAVLGAVPAGQVLDDLTLELEDGADATFADIDTHHWLTKPTVDGLNKWLADIQPDFDAAWLTHGAGLRLVYVGKYHRPRAVAAALAVSPSFKVELKTSSRHPLSTRADKPGVLCGPVQYGACNPAAEYVFKLSGNFTAELRSQALAKLGFADGGRYSHDRCPLDPSAHTNAADCVVVYSNVVKCWRCEGAGTRYKPGMRPGIFPLAAVVGLEATDLDRLVKHKVHWQHARLELQAVYPNLAENVLADAYRHGLRGWHQRDEGEQGVSASQITAVSRLIAMAFEPALDFIWAGAWLAESCNAIRAVDADAADSAPYCKSLFKAKLDDGTEEWQVAPDKAKRSQFRNSTPAGYRPVRPYRGLDLRASNGATVPVMVQPGPRYACRILTDPLPIEDAFKRIERAFPSIDRAYLQGALAAGICAARGGGRRPQLCADGPSGSGKGETVRLAASFLGDDAQKIRITASEEEINRYIGSALTMGHRFLLIDELGKVGRLGDKFGALLQFSSTVTWRPLYRPPVTTDFDAAIFYPSVSFPDWLRKSPEFCRRTRRIRLTKRVDEWSAACGGDTTEWRDKAKENAHAANSLLTHVYQLCAAQAFNWDAIADALGIGRLDDDADVADDAVYRRLYRYCRGDLGPVEYIDDPTGGFKRGWVDLYKGVAKDVLESIVDFDDFDRKRAAKNAKHNLEALAWNNILGFDRPAVRFRVRIHGGKWGGRFECPAMRGRELLNEQLPAIPGDPPAQPAPAKTLTDTGKDKLEAAGVKL